MINLGTIFWCATIILGTLDNAKALSFIIYNGSLTNTFETPVDNPLPLLPYIDTLKNTTICAFGFENVINGTATNTTILAYLSRSDTNVILLNWSAESRGPVSGMLGYGAVVARVPSIAGQVAEALVQLFQNNVLPSRCRLVGHSLGAHMVGMTGTRLKGRNYIVASIWGLDPAGPSYESSAVERLNASQAENVFTIITNPGQYGLNEGLGSINFWVNCGITGRQPGCPFTIFPLPYNSPYCSHDRSWMILSEALRNLGLFPAALCDSCTIWKSTNSSNVINYIGDNVDPNKKGNFYLSTNSASPFSKGQAGLRPN